MWHAWLGFEVTQRDKELEAIEGGDLNKSKQRYSDLLSESIEQMFKVLKYDRWLSIVFVHKDPAYWDTIIKSCQHSGFEYMNTAVQPVDVVWSMHKKKNPLTVLSGELVLNFRKVRNPKTIAITKMGSDVTQLIKNTAEQTIVSNDGGATTEEIYHALIPILLEHGLLGAVKDKLDDITPLLHQEFVFSDMNNQWQIRENTKLGSFIKLEERIRFYLLDFLKRAERENKAVTFNEIIQDVMPKLINGKTPESQTILSVLKKLAYSPDNEHWSLAPILTSSQFTMAFDSESLMPSKMPRLTVPTLAKDIEHNTLIYRLFQMGRAAGFVVWIGKQEQTANFNGEAFATLSVPKLPLKAMTTTQEQKVQQIDVIWFNVDGSPAYAFEVETSTTITSALERFSELLEVSPKIARRLIIVAPKSRRRKLNQVLEKSIFIGQPLYMETKVMYMFAEELVNLYHELENSNPSKIIQSLSKICISPMS